MMHAIHDLRLVYGDPSLPGDMTEIPHQPETPPPQKPLDLSTQTQRLQRGGWQGSVWCDGHQVLIGRPRSTQAAAQEDADDACEKITDQILEGLQADMGRPP